MDIKSKLMKNNRGVFNFEAEGYVDNKKACKAEFSLILPGSINIKVKK